VTLAKGTTMTRDDLVIPLVAAAMLLAFAGVVGYQALDWLQTGVWPGFPISRLLPVAAVGELSTLTDWQGLQNIIEFVLNLHVGFLILLVGWLVALSLIY
jgi:hypothetical protein